MAFGKKLSLSRVGNPCFVLFLVIFQVIFILFLYRGRASIPPQETLDVPSVVDFSKTEDVYTNLSFFTHAPHNKARPSCAESPIMVGLLTVSFDVLPSEQQIIRKNPYVRSGGCYRPPHCLANYKTAVIVPHKNHGKHLRHFLYYLHPFLQRQQLIYCIYVIHQAGSGPFNRAKLFNVGVREALKDDDWDCLLMHDVELIPENDYNYYICHDYYPKHLSTAIDKLDYRLPYWSFFGGVIALTPEHYMKINGFPNTYWDRGGEDDDIALRLHIVGMAVFRAPFYLGRYKMTDFGQAADRVNAFRRHEELETRKTWKDDGMNSLVFKLLAKKKHPLYINITVDIGAAPVHPSKRKRQVSSA